MLRILPFLLFVFTVCLIVFSIILTYEVDDADSANDFSKIDQKTLDFVRYGNMVQAGLLALALIAYFTGVSSNIYLSKRLGNVDIKDVGLN